MNKIVLLLLVASNAFAYMDKPTVLDGFKHAQKAPQMGRPVPYKKSKEMFHGAKHKRKKKSKKGLGRHDQKPALHGIVSFGSASAFAFGSKREPVPSTPSPTPLPSGTVSPSPSPGKSGTPTPVPNPTPGIKSADLRSRDSSIKDQVGPICTAYAGAASIENLIGGSSPDFSEPYVFSLYGEYSVDAFAAAVPGAPLALNADYDRSIGENLGTVDSPKVTSHKLIQMTWLGDGEIEKAKSALDKGHPVYTGLEVAEDMASCLASIRPSSKLTSGGHAVEFIGYQDDASNPALGGGYFILKNSWSTACGDHGYQYWPYSMCDKSYCYFYEMESAE